MNSDEIERLSEMVKIHEKRLYVLERQAAQFGINCPPHILLEIDDIKESIKNFKDQIDNKVVLSYPQARQSISQFRSHLDNLQHELQRVVIKEERIYRFLGIPVWTVSIVVSRVIQTVLALISVGIIIISLGFAVQTIGLFPHPIHPTPFIPTNTILTYGPVDGNLLSLNGREAIFKSGISVRNFISSARFYNPDKSSNGFWRYGFCTHTKGDSFASPSGCFPQSVGFFVLTVTSLSKLELYTYEGGDHLKYLLHETISNLRTSDGEFNDIKLVANNNEISIFVNDVFVASTPAADNLSESDVWIVAELDKTNNSKAMKFQQFTIWSIK